MFGFLFVVDWLASHYGGSTAVGSIASDCVYFNCQGWCSEVSAHRKTVLCCVNWPQLSALEGIPSVRPSEASIVRRLLTRNP